MLRILLFFLFLGQPFYACQVQDNLIQGKVIQVADGDTITLLLQGQKKLKVRLYGVDCPEYKQDFSTAARNFTKKQVYQQTVSVKEMDVDQYGRVVGIVFLPDGTELNTDLLKNGLAWHYTQFDQSLEYAQAMKEAQIKKIGIWSMNSPVPPWEFRRNQRRK